MDFKELIQKDREGKKEEDFQITFLEYLNLIASKSEIVELSHKRLYEAVVKQGVEKIKPEEDGRAREIYGDKVIKRYNFFKNDFFGIDKTLMKIVNFLYSASMKGEEARQVLYLVGPVGSGKSSIVDALKKALEGCDQVYSLKDCPMREEPLHLLPRHLRKEIQDSLGIEIEGDLCPACRYRLIEEYKGEYERFPVVKSSFSARGRKGIGVVTPVDPNNQDTSVLIGSVDISKMDLYTEDDPRIFSLNGAFNVGNRGIVEFIEVFKNDVEYLHTIITATQEKYIPSPGKGAMIYFDGVIIAHSNEAEWVKFKMDHTNEAILDRIVKIEVPYCLELNEEIKIYNKILNKSSFKAHVAPHTIEVAAMFAILTRLASSSKVDELTKLKIYNGEEIVEKGTTKRIHITELIDELEVREGMEGISTRFIIKAIDAALCDSECNCINPLTVINSLTEAIKDLDIGDETKKKYLRFLQETIRCEYKQMLEKEITKAFIHGFREQAEDLFNNYLDQAEAFVKNTKLEDKYSPNLLEVDESFMKNIEEQIGIMESSAKGFRIDVTSYVCYLLEKGENIDYSCYPPLKDAIEKKVIASVRWLSRVITKSQIRDKNQQIKYDTVIEEMKNNGYCENCSQVILEYAANNLWKD